MYFCKRKLLAPMHPYSNLLLLAYKCEIIKYMDHDIDCIFRLHVHFLYILISCVLFAHISISNTQKWCSIRCNWLIYLTTVYKYWYTLDLLILLLNNFIIVTQFESIAVCALYLRLIHSTVFHSSVYLLTFYAHFDFPILISVK